MIKKSLLFFCCGVMSRKTILRLFCKETLYYRIYTAFFWLLKSQVLINLLEMVQLEQNYIQDRYQAKHT